MKMEPTLTELDDTIEPELRLSAKRTSTRRMARQMDSRPAGFIYFELQTPGLNRSP